MKRAVYWTCLVFSFIVSVSSGAEKELLLPRDDLSPWIRHAGAWKVVEAATIDAGNPRKLSLEEGKGVLVNGDAGRTLNLFSRAWHGDVQAHIEFMIPKGSNSGIYFMGRYEIQVYDSYGKKRVGFGDCGGIYQRWDNGRGFEGHGAKVNASKAAGEWQTFDVTFKAPRFDENGRKIANARFVKVVHNGTVIHENVDVTGPTRSPGFHNERSLGPIMLQGDHGPVAYRNIRLDGIIVEPPDADEFEENLAWHAADAQAAPRSTGGPDTGIRFENKSGKPVKLFWIDYKGQRKPYGELAPGGTREQGTVEGNTWLITNTEGWPLGYFIAKPYPSRAIIPTTK
ncbi:MAG: family 16 glycoside hydrolase [Planctomycetota bacterium]|nr:family 16 glycoside hydrolase [Planctomycetota bacterium]